MAGSFYNGKDSVDISELAALNDDISDDLIDQLQQKISQTINPNSPVPTVNENDDSALFEETAAPAKEETLPKPEDSAPNPETAANISEQSEQKTPEKDENAVQNPETSPEKEKSSSENSSSSAKKEKLEINQTFDDNFIKKYKAKLQKKQKDNNTEAPSYGGVAPAEETNSNAPIESLSKGNITERELTDDLKNYNDSLDFLDGNVKYSKYVIYISPENVDFIEVLTVKERKNLINGILKQQNDITITKQRFKHMQIVLRHIIVLILTLAISIPLIYQVINAALETTIDNHRSAQTNWQALYREKGKITKN